MVMASKPPAGIQLNSNHPLSQGLIGCWLLNEGAGLRANDLSGRYNTGVLTNFEPFSTTSGWSGGKYGTSLKFNGVNNYVLLDNVKLSVYVNNSTGSRFTVEGMFLSNDVSGPGHHVFGSSASANSRFGIDVTGNTLRSTIYNGAAFEGVASSITIKADTWYSFTYSFDGTTKVGILTLNGVLQTGVSRGLATSAARSVIGMATNVTEEPWNGIISHVRVWNRLLSLEESKQLYSQPYAMFRTIER